MTRSAVGPSGRGGGATGPHEVDRALRELLEEERIAQMGGQILLGFLLAVAYTPVMSAASSQDHTLYAWALVITTAAVVLLLATVPLHRLNFGHRVRSPVLVVGHLLSLSGLAALAGGIVLSIRLAARIALPEHEAVLTVVASLLILIAWLVVPLLVRMSARATTADGPLLEGGTAGARG